MENKDVENLNITNSTNPNTEFAVIDPETGEATGEEVKQEDFIPNVSEQQLSQLLKNMRDMMGILEAQWNSTRAEFQLTEDHMKELYHYNEQHRDPPPPEALNEDGSLKEMNELEVVGEDGNVLYNPFNGLLKITESEIDEIFGENHPLVSTLAHSVTLDRIQSVIKDFFSWMTSSKEYRQIHDSYMSLIEEKEEHQIQKLIKLRDETEDGYKREELTKVIDFYYNRKHLGFLKDPLDEKELESVISAWSNEQKVGYWLKKSQDKLKQLNISAKFILEISKFEERFLIEPYHHQNNILLTYFVSKCAHINPYDRKDPDQNKIVSMVIGLDRFIRNQWKPEDREIILNNIISFEEQFLGKLPNCPDFVKENL